MDILRRRSASLTAVAFAFGGPVFSSAAWAQKTPPAVVVIAKPVAAPATKNEAYYGVYLQNAKVGWFVFSRDDHAILPGTNRPTIRTDAKTVIDLVVMGANANQVITSITWSQPKTGKPLAEQTITQAGGRETRVSVTYGERDLFFEADLQGENKKGTLTLAPGETFLADPQNGGGDFAPKAGDTMRGKVFSSELLKLVDCEQTVVGEETLTIGGQAVVVWKVLDKNPVGPSTIYLNAQGDLLRVDTLLGMQIRKEPKEIALAAPDEKTPPPDLISLVGIKPTGASLSDARQLQTATYEVSHVTRPLPPADSVQTAISLAAPSAADAQTLTVTVTTQHVPGGKTAPLFTSAAPAAPANLRPFLQASLYVPTGDPEFAALARRVIGRETETGKAAQKLAAYVHQTIVPDPALPALRTARDILHEPRGVCRDYTTLFATLARSVGLPTKQCTGIVYAGGAFLYHAWPEVWVGKNARTGADQWVALEPTWGKPWADATHVKLTEGEITDVYSIAADIGHYQIKVLQTGTMAAKPAL